MYINYLVICPNSFYYTLFKQQKTNHFSKSTFLLQNFAIYYIISKQYQKQSLSSSVGYHYVLVLFIHSSYTIVSNGVNLDIIKIYIFMHSTTF